MNILKLFLEYLTKASVKTDIDITSINREIEYKIGTQKLLFHIKGTEIKFARVSTSLQHRFKPCPATGCNT